MLLNLVGGVNMDGIINFIGNLGFPIAISLYLLMRIEGKLEILTNSIYALTNVITSKTEK